MAQTVTHCPVTTEAQVQSQVSPHQIYGGQSGTEAGFPLSTVLLFSPVSIIPPLLFNSFIHPSIPDAIRS
jgi:hypothetical protein